MTDVENSRAEGRERVVEAMRDALAMFTEWQLATLEMMPHRASKTARLRQDNIASEMVQACSRFGVSPGIYHGRRSCQRLAARLTPPGDET